MVDGVLDRESRVLVVDDNDDTRELYAFAFEQAGFVVETACDGVDALEKLASASFDAIVTDLAMPRLDGWELVRRVKASTPDLFVLVLTGQGRDGAARQALEAGADGLCIKPCLPQDVIASVARSVKT